MAIRPVPWKHPDAVALRAAQQAEIAKVYGVPDSEPGMKPSAADVKLFLVAYDGATAVGCGGLRTDPRPEIKRMYVVPAARGTGVAAAILHALEKAAKKERIGVLRLETGDRLVAARRFYEREGYQQIPCFGAYASSRLSVCYGRDLMAPRHS